MARKVTYVVMLGFAFLASVASAQSVKTECYGDICVTTTDDGRGNIDVKTTSPHGDNYSLSTRSTRLPNGDVNVQSTDSLGNSYEIRSWCDAEGCHSKDSAGNICTVTKSGKMIGCGQ